MKPSHEQVPLILNLQWKEGGMRGNVCRPAEIQNLSFQEHMESWCTYISIAADNCGNYYVLVVT